MGALAAPHVLEAALDAPPAAALTNALAAGGRLLSLLTDAAILVYAFRRSPERLAVVATIGCADGPEAHAWAPDGSLLAFATARRLQRQPNDSFRLLHSLPTYYIPTSLAVAHLEGASWRVAVGGANGVEVYAVKPAECTLAFAHKGSHIAALTFTRSTPSSCSLLLAAFDGHIGSLHLPPADQAPSSIAWLDWVDTSRVTSVCLAPNGARLGVAGWDGATQLYDVGGTEAPTLTRVSAQYAPAVSARSGADTRAALMAWAPNSTRVALTRHTAGAAVALTVPTDGLPEWTLPGAPPAGLVSVPGEQLVVTCDRESGLRAFYWPLSATSPDPCNLPLHSLALTTPTLSHAPLAPQAFLKTAPVWNQRSLSLCATWSSASLTVPAAFLHRAIELRRFGSACIALSGSALAVAMGESVFVCSVEAKRWLMLVHSFPVQSMCLCGDVLVVLEGPPDTPQLCVWDVHSGSRLIRQALAPPLPPARCLLVGSPEAAPPHAQFAVVHAHDVIVGRLTRTEGQCALTQTHTPLPVHAAGEALLEWRDVQRAIDAAKPAPPKAVGV